jgi:soluble lytic murein transglycosylase
MRMGLRRLLRFCGLAAAATPLVCLPPAAQETPSQPSSLERAAELRRAGDLLGAEALLKQAWTASSGEDKTPALALGNLLLMEGKPADAEAPLREAADSKGPLAPYGALLLARCRLAQDDAGEARKLLAPLLSSKASEKLAQDAAEAEAEAIERSGRPAEAAAAWAKLAEKSGRRGSKDALRLRLAQSLEGAGSWPRAASEYRRLYLDAKSPYGREAGLALGRLVAAGRAKPEPRAPLQKLDLARRFLAAGRREDALDLLDSLPGLKGPEDFEAAYLRVAALYALRDNAACAREADSMLQKFGPKKAVFQALLKAAWASLRTGDHGEVVRRCQKLLDLCGKEEGLRAEALHCWGTSSYTHGLFADAIGRFEAAQTMKAPPALAGSILHKKAWCLYRLQRWDEARAAFSAAASGGRDTALSCAFASGLASLRAGDRAGFLDAMVRLAYEAPGYWSWRAREALAAQGVALSEERLSPLAAAPWDPPCDGPGTALARSLDLCGLEGFAAEALQPALPKPVKDPATALTYGLLLARSGRYGAAQAVLARAFGPVLRSWACPPVLLEAAYPAPNLHWVRREAERASVDPALILAVTRQESFFDEGAFSPAGAQGLMQIMPETARALVGGDPAGNLLDPSRNLGLGAAYLAQLRRRFALPAALAAYNAGEEVVGQWVSAFGDQEPEEFVGMIPYQETRQYTAQVLWNLHVYRGILGEKD